MIRVKKPAKPTLDQTKWLRRIAQSPMIKTYVGSQMPVFHLTTGEAIPVKVAMALIRNGWVKGQRDGMFDDPQSYVVLTP